MALTYKSIGYGNTTMASSSTDSSITVDSYGYVNGLHELLQGYIGKVNNDETRSILNNAINQYSTIYSDTNITLPNNSVYTNLKFDHTGSLEVNLNVVGSDNNIFCYNDATTNYVVYSGCGDTVDLLKDSRRQAIRMNLSSVMIKSRAVPIVADTPAEALAMEALREVVTEAEFKKYLKYGFVLVKGRSGATYQVYRNRSHVKVWVGGRVIKEICVYLKTVEGMRAPDTDKVVAFKAMIETDEEAFKAMGNRYRMAA
jgi:hypothetical protein